MSLSAHKSAGDIVSEILMSRTGFNGSFLVVEGDDDSRFFRGRVAKNACEIVIAGGKSAVEGSIHELDAQQFRGALGICDDDCTSLNGCRTSSSNLLNTDSRDLDTWLVRSSALERLLAEYGDGNNIDAFETKNGSVRDNLVRIASPFGRLRWLSARDSMGINFDKLGPFRFVKTTWAFDLDELFYAAAQQINANAVTLHALTDALPNVDPWLVCHGHDLLDILAIALRHGVLGTRSPSSKQIASVLRASLDNAHWLASQLATDIRLWERNNAPFRIL